MRFRSIGVAPMRGGSHFLCCCKESNQRKQPIRPMGTQVATRDIRGMEQHLSVRLCAEPFLARPWLPPRAFVVFGAAAFSSALALRARTKESSDTLFECDGQSGFDERWHCHAARLRLLLCRASARSARRMNDAAPMKRVLRCGSQGSARKGYLMRATLRGCSIPRMSRARTS